MVINSAVDMKDNKTVSLINKKICYKKKLVTIISVCQLDWPKDPLTLIKAFKIAFEKVPNLQLLILGEGSAKKALINYVHAENIMNISFLGWKKNMSVIKHLKKSDIFVLSTISDAYPRVILEALTVGLPVISTDANYGPREILDYGKYGILVPVGDHSALADKLVELSISTNMRRFYKERALFRSKYYKPERMLEEYEKLILRII
jgi:glycosyltransferase involved in cell wall biosynthesis